jgi:hypothetical protein
MALTSFFAYLGITFLLDDLVTTRWPAIRGRIIPSFGELDYMAVTLTFVTFLAIATVALIMLFPRPWVYRTQLSLAVVSFFCTLWQVWRYSWNGEEAVIVTLQFFAAVLLIIGSIIGLKKMSKKHAA